MVAIIVLALLQPVQAFVVVDNGVTTTSPLSAKHKSKFNTILQQSSKSSSSSSSITTSTELITSNSSSSKKGKLLVLGGTGKFFL